MINKIQHMILPIQLKLHSLKKKVIKSIVRKLQPGAENFFCLNGKLLVTLLPRNYYCNKCLCKAIRSDLYDRFACLNCNQWLEEGCGDKNCWNKFCNQRIPNPNQCTDLDLKQLALTAAKRADAIGCEFSTQAGEMPNMHDINAILKNLAIKLTTEINTQKRKITLAEITGLFLCSPKC